MSGKADHRTVLKALEKIDVKGKLTRRNLTTLRERFGLRFTEAVKIVKERRVKKYVFKPSGKVVWIVVGRGYDYIIYPDAPYCHCEDFYQYIMGGKAEACKHLIAQRLAFQMGMFDTVTEEDGNYLSLMDEWRNAGLS